MCGIIGYIGKKDVQPILMEGLRRMEYRGYDSAGLAVVDGKTMGVCKKQGKLTNLANELQEHDLPGTVGVGHIRWATHGAPTDLNAHPHADCQGEIFVVHNGIIENYHELRDMLKERGHEFTTQTDTEVLPHLIEEMMKSDEPKAGHKKPLEQAVTEALALVQGAYGLAILSSAEPEKIVAARLGSPLVLGVVAPGEYVVASDVTAIMPHTRDVIYVEDGDILTLTPAGYKITTLQNETLDRQTTTVDWDVTQAEKSGYPHFMLKEIMEQPDAVENALRGRLIVEEGIAHLGGLNEQAERLSKVNQVIIIACGTAYYAGLVGEYMLEEYAGLPVQVEYASEFRYRKPVLDENTAVIVISQSGETADTLAALREAKRKGALTIGVVNVVGSTIAREVDCGVYTHAGPEIAVASTKATMAQLTVLALITLFLGRQRGMSLVTGKRIAEELRDIPAKLRTVLSNRSELDQLAKQYAKFTHFYFLGRKYLYPMAMEGALKLKEVSYLHAEGYPSGEMKHGPIALIDDSFPSFILTPRDSVYEKNVSNLQEIKARGGNIIALATEGDETVKSMVDAVVYIPKTLEMLTPMLAVVPMQLFAYYCAVVLGRDVDQPRNLAKSVTVE
ncbi:MAG: glutamine--fructose-6-phosphate transaminase (isomerizing) [Patescibacteria group bacterium]